MDLNKKALSLSYFTVGYNILEGIISVRARLLAGGSIALAGSIWYSNIPPAFRAFLI
jgi:hypothetical protein